MAHSLQVTDTFPAQPLENFSQNPVVLTPAAMSGDVNNYNPPGLAQCDILRIATGGSARNITGLAAQPAGTTILIINTDTTNSVTLKAASGSSTAANQFLGTNAADVVIRKGGAVYVTYDATLAWVTILI